MSGILSQTYVGARSCMISLPTDTQGHDPEGFLTGQVGRHGYFDKNTLCIKSMILDIHRQIKHTSGC